MPARRSAPWSRALGLALAMGLGAVGAWLVLAPPDESRPISRVSMALGDVALPLRNVGGRPGRTVIAVTPDGRTVIFRGQQGSTKLFARALDQVAATAISGTDDGAVPFLSPDGKWLGFWADGKLKKVPLGGGPPITICEAPMVGVPDGVFGASWGAHDTFAFSDGRVIWTVPASGGAPTPLTTLDASKHERAHLLPFWLPDERALLYTRSSATDLSTGASVVVRAIASGDQRTVIDTGADGRYVSTGHLVYMQVGALMAVPFDLSLLEVRGSAVGLLDGVMQAVNADNVTRESGAGQYAIAENGTLAYIAGGIRPDSQSTLVWVDRHGVETPIGEPTGPYQSPRVSPDGQWMAFGRSRRGMRAADIWAYDVKRQASTRLTSGGNNTTPVWSPDGGRLAYRHTESTSVRLMSQSLDGGSGQEIPAKGLTSGTSTAVPSIGAWSRERNSLLLASSSGQMFELPLDGDHTVKEILAGQSVVSHPALSPDGHWLAYVSDESGEAAVYVRPYPGLGQPIRVSSNAGSEPAWGPGGRELFYLRRVNPNPGPSPVALVAVDVDTAGGFASGKPRVLFSGSFMMGIPVRSYDVAPDGQRFLMQKLPESVESPQTAINLVLNWTDDLRTRAP